MRSDLHPAVRRRRRVSLRTRISARHQRPLVLRSPDPSLDNWAPDWEPGHRVVASWVSYVDRVRSGQVNVSDLYFDPGFEFYGVVRIYSARPTTYSQNCFFASFVARYLHAISIYLHFHCFKRKLLAAMSIDTVTSNVVFSASSAAHELKSTPRKQLVFESFIEISVQNTKLEILFFFESLFPI